MSKKITTDWRLERLIKREFLSEIEKKRNEIHEECREVLKEKYLTLVPEELVDYWKKYPTSIKLAETIFLNNFCHQPGFYESIKVEVPYVISSEKFTDYVRTDVVLMMKMRNLISEYIRLDNVYKSLLDEVLKLIKDCSTFEVLDQVYPDLSKFLREKSDLEKPVESPCDSIERVRAAINKVKK